MIDQGETEDIQAWDRSVVVELIVAVLVQVAWSVQKNSAHGKWLFQGHREACRN